MALFLGLESQDYADDADHFAFYDVNTVGIRSLDRCLSGAPIGSAFERAADDQFVAVPFPKIPILAERMPSTGVASDGRVGRYAPSPVRR